MEDIPGSKLVFLSVLTFIFGVFISPYFRGIYFILAIFLPLLKHRKIVFLLTLAFVVGVLHYQISTTQEFILPLFKGEKIELVGHLVEEDRNVLEIDELDEKAIIYIDGSLNYGQKILIKGVPIVPDENFKSYLHKDAISVSFFNPDIEILGEKKSIRYYIFKGRRLLRRKIDKGLTFPESAILNALLLGDRTGISDDLQEKFSSIGVAHLLAVSGTHIVIISALLANAAVFLKIKFKALFVTGSLFIFIILIGAPSSAIRAGLLGFSFIFADKVGRKASSLRVLVYIATVMLLFNPRLLLDDVGFQLSFLAATGIVLFSKKIKRFLSVEFVDYSESFLAEVRKRISETTSKIPHFINETISVTLSAQIFVFPLIYLYFGNLPFMAFFSNLLIAPLLPIIIVSGVTSLIFSFFLPEILAFSFSFLFLRIVFYLVEIFYALCVLC